MVPHTETSVPAFETVIYRKLDLIKNLIEKFHECQLEMFMIQELLVIVYDTRDYDEHHIPGVQT